jgi:hypothetical protein
MSLVYRSIRVYVRSENPKALESAWKAIQAKTDEDIQSIHKHCEEAQFTGFSVEEKRMVFNADSECAPPSPYKLLNPLSKRFPDVEFLFDLDWYSTVEESQGRLVTVYKNGEKIFNWAYYFTEGPFLEWYCEKNDRDIDKVREEITMGVSDSITALMDQADLLDDEFVEKLTIDQFYQMYLQRKADDELITDCDDAGYLNEDQPLWWDDLKYDWDWGIGKFA